MVNPIVRTVKGYNATIRCSYLRSNQDQIFISYGYWLVIQDTSVQA